MKNLELKDYAVSIFTTMVLFLIAIPMTAILLKVMKIAIEAGLFNW